MVVAVEVCMGVIMVVLGKADFKTMDVVTMSHAHNRLEFMGFRNVLKRFQIHARDFKFKGLLRPVRAERLDRNLVVFIKPC